MRGGCTSRPGEVNFPKIPPKHPFSIFNPTPAEATPPPHTSDLALPLLTSFARTGLAQDTKTKTRHPACHDFVRYGGMCVVVHLSGKIERPSSCTYSGRWE